MSRQEEANVNIIGFVGIMRNVYRNAKLISMQEVKKCYEHTKEWEGS